MTIRLTSPELFDKVLEKLKRDTFWNEEVNRPFLEYCYEDIRDKIGQRDDEYYLDVEWEFNGRLGKVVVSIRYHKHSDIMTDKEFLNDNE